MENFKRNKTEFEQNGNKITYDACSNYSIEKAKDYYEPLGFKYIGSGNIIYVNGFKNTFPDLYHFFIKNK